MSMKAGRLLNKILITLFLISVTLIAASACAVSEATCDDIDVSAYGGEITITGIVGIRVMRHNDDLTWSQANDTFATPAESLRILIEMDHIRQQEKSSAASQQSDKTVWQQLFGTLRVAVSDTLISTAHACQPTNSATLTSKIVGMDLTSSESYRGNAAGDSLRSEFTVSMVPFDGIEPNNSAFWYRPITIGNILSASSSTFRPASSYRFEPAVRESRTDGERTVGLHRFSFSIELDTGEMFTVSSAPVLVAI